MYLPDTNAPTVVKHTVGCLLNLEFQRLFSVTMSPSLHQTNTSNKYMPFPKQWDFVHDTSSPELAQSNGFEERMIHT